MDDDKRKVVFNMDEDEAEKLDRQESFREKAERRGWGSGSGAPANTTQYVTKKQLIITVIIGMLIAAVVTFAAVRLTSGTTVGHHYKNLTTSDMQNSTKSRQSIAQIAKENANSVVEIVTKSETGNSLFGSAEEEGAGSGVIVKKNGYIVTNYHVVDGANTIQVKLHNGNEYGAQVVGTDSQNDIAVLKIDADNLDAAVIGKSRDLEVGDLAVVIGNPLGQLGGTTTQGIISATDRQLSYGGRTLTLLQTDAAINAGNSGGGLFNGSGELVGIVDAKASGTGIEGLGFALPIDTVAPIADDIISSGHVKNRPAVGITIYEMSDDEAQYNGLDKGGIYIKDVTGDNAKKAGLKSGDRITELDGKTVDSTNSFITEIQKHKIGDEVTIRVDRNGQSQDIKVKLEDSSKVNQNSDSSNSSNADK